MKVCTIVGTRPEVIRLSEIIKLLNKSSVIEHVLVHTCQNFTYELNQIFFADFELPLPQYTLELEQGSFATRLGSMLKQVEVVLVKEKPDAVLILGDTYSCLSALIAKNLKIPIFHMEAGNRCFDLNVPEETNRKIVDHISDINIPYSSIAREYLISEGVTPQNIIKLGSPMCEVLNANMDKILASTILERLGLEKSKYILCSIHRAENVDTKEVLHAIFNGISAVSEWLNVPAIVSTHPKTEDRLKGFPLSSNIKLLKPMNFSDYNRLQIDSSLVLSDSGTISEESSLLKFRAINVRTSHERPEAMEDSIVIMSGVTSEGILESSKLALSLPIPKKTVTDYNVSNVSEKVLKVLLSYTHYVNRNSY